MSILVVKNLNHNYGGREILTDVNFVINKGEHIGFVGANGEGKSSLMNIITDKFMPDDGEVIWSKRVRVSYLDQHSSVSKDDTIRDVLNSAFSYLFSLEQEMNEIYENIANFSDEEMYKNLEEAGILQDLLTHNDFYLIDAKVEEIAKAFDIDKLGLDKLASELSSGQKSKVLLCKLLLEKPDIMLLDEPTNYLDEHHINWLRRYLQTYENAFFLISHDMEFLNSVVNLVFHIENCSLERYVGDYEEFKRVYAVKQSQIEAKYKRQQAEIAKLKDFVARNKARVSTRNMAMSRQKKLDKMDIIELKKEKPKPEFDFLLASSTGKVIFETENLVIGYNKPLSKELNLRMQRGDKIVITGTNGIGKTTLLLTILSKINAISGNTILGENLKLAYFNQNSDTNPDNTTIDEFWAVYPELNQAEVRARLAKCGLGTEQMESKVKVLSGGEEAKLRLAKIMYKESNVLLLDEPTNHLDVDAKEELKRAILEYKGGVFIISHEKSFYESIAKTIWNMEDFIL